MRVLMLGWEFPPHIAGGLGIACYGMAKALGEQQVPVMFVLPEPVPRSSTGGVQVTGTAAPAYQVAGRAAGERGLPELANVSYQTMPAAFSNPYGPLPVGAAPVRPVRANGDSGSGPRQYRGDLVAAAQKYAALCLERFRGESFDVIHAHDWLTFPAGMALAGATGRPLVVHVHSTEYDRSPGAPRPEIVQIERRGTHAALRVVAVSHLTRAVLEDRYGVPRQRIEVVYNAPADAPPAHATARRIDRGDRVVLFLGRITGQKGPAYFVQAAKRVLEKMPQAKFVMAGSGDQLGATVELAAAQGVGHKVLFTGFLEPDDVDRVFRMADVYVMPSVSEPFGLTSLEAIAHDVPTIVSRSSGAAEVLKHALKVDFGDVDDLADKILALLRRPSLATTLRPRAQIEIRRLSWDQAAMQLQAVYQQAMAQTPQVR